MNLRRGRGGRYTGLGALCLAGILVSGCFLRPSPSDVSRPALRGTVPAQQARAPMPVDDGGLVAQGARLDAAAVPVSVTALPPVDSEIGAHASEPRSPKLDTAPVPIAPTAPPIADAQPRVVVVAAGDTLYSIARANQVAIRSLIEVNDLEPPYTLAIGQRLSVRSLPEYIVRTEDTVYRIARCTGVDLALLTRINAIPAPYTIAVGQRLRMPTAMRVPECPEYARLKATPVDPAPLPVAQDPAIPDSVAPLAEAPSEQAAPEVIAEAPGAVFAEGEEIGALAAARPDEKPDKLDPPLAGEGPGGDMTIDAMLVAVGRPPSKPMPPGSEAGLYAHPTSRPKALSGRTPGPPPARGSGTFLWPVEGPVISNFGAKDGNRHNDGVNIAADYGAPVRASENGVVVYAGNELKGYGNLLLIRHAEGWTTAYAHNRDLLVDRGEQVTRGQVIAHVGSSGNVAAPQSHFEIRKNSQSVDPVSYLSLK